MNREAYERVIANVLRAHPDATRAGVVEMLRELWGVVPDEEEGVMDNAGVQAVLATMKRLGIEVSRESFIGFNWPEGEPEGAEAELQMPRKLRNGYEAEPEDEDAE